MLSHLLRLFVRKPKGRFCGQIVFYWYYKNLGCYRNQRFRTATRTLKYMLVASQLLTSSACGNKFPRHILYRVFRDVSSQRQSNFDLTLFLLQIRGQSTTSQVKSAFSWHKWYNENSLFQLLRNCAVFIERLKGRLSPSVPVGTHTLVRLLSWYNTFGLV